MKLSTISIVEALRDPRLLGGALGDLSSWSRWLVRLKALFALPLDENELEAYRAHTGRADPPLEPAREGWDIVGRRGGKSMIAAVVAVYVAFFRDYRRVLSPGERGVVMLLAADRRQARVLFRYVTGLIESSPLLSSMVEERLKETIRLSNGIDIEIHTSNYRSVRGYTIVAAICDEIAFWRSEESTNPDTEVINAIRPAMATVPGALLLCISSPYARQGALWTAYDEHYGKEGDSVLVWKATSREMNPTIPQKVVEQALEEDEIAARAEWLGEFRNDIETFVSHEIVGRCAYASESPPDARFRYVAFCDPAGGSGRDSMTMAIAHAETRNDVGRVVLDLVREVKPPFSPEQTVRAFAEILKEYDLHTVQGDRYAGGVIAEMFSKHGIRYEWSDRTKSEIYLSLLPLINSSKVELLDNERLLRQLVSLERRTSRSGKDSVDHKPRGSDDLINAAAGAIVLAATEAHREPARLWSISRPGLDVPIHLTNDFTRF